MSIPKSTFCDCLQSYMKLKSYCSFNSLTERKGTNTKWEKITRVVCQTPVFHEDFLSKNNISIFNFYNIVKLIILRFFCESIFSYHHVNNMLTREDREVSHQFEQTLNVIGWSNSLIRHGQNHENGFSKFKIQILKNRSQNILKNFNEN